MKVSKNHLIQDKPLPYFPLDSGNIGAGGGYSTDSQQVPSQHCYNANVSSISGQSAIFQLNTAQSFSDIQKDLKISITLKGGYGMFSAEAQANYLHSIEDKEYSESLNYYYYASTTALIQIAEYGLGALTASGRTFYNNGSNPYFGIFCGDQYINSYDEGAMLLMGINIQFSSHYEKTQFDDNTHASFGDIFSAAGQIQSMASQYGISGSVVIQAFQIGGDPSQLSYILNKDSSGNYYALTCNLNAMTDCISAASGMLNYAKYNFTTQFSFKDNTGLTPLGSGFMSYNPIYYIGLTPPPTLVTNQVMEDRNELANALLENQYYEQNLYSLLYGYPVAWDAESNLYLNLQNLYTKAQNNIEILTNPENPQAGGLGCYTFPDECYTIAKNINASLVPITADDLTVLQPLQYTLPSDFVTYYFTGSGYKPLPQPESAAGECFNSFVSASINDTYFSEIVHYLYDQCRSIATYCVVASSTNGIVYQGHSCSTAGWNCGSISNPGIWTKTLSPFWFDTYNNSDSNPEVSGEAQTLHIEHI